ncbi:hypothetical protein JCGZ_01235 [Jatropha curcas]|uniref:AP2/ERF domain-containing protein n=1 Tax=Jatropha curcas TaxID=180498 RepID=A0A067LJD7_JATCU|nr:hypothetical protein JCGZ_01235 [Jatropha curcas]
MSGSRTTTTAETAKYKGVRRRKWGKWVSEIRVPGTQGRLWLGSYSSPEAAAVAHDIASYCLRGHSSIDSLNFPDLMLPASVRGDISPTSIQKAASDAGMAVDAQMIMNRVGSSDNEVNGNEGSGNGAVLGSETEQLEWGDVGGDGGRGNWSGSGSQSRDSGDSLNISVEDYYF